MGKVKMKPCEFEPCGQMFEAKKMNTSLWQAFCPDCVKKHVWVSSHHRVNRIKEINAQKNK